MRSIDLKIDDIWGLDLSMTGHCDVVLFRDKLDVVSVKGLLISMSGFTPEAIKKAVSYRDEREILLMDGTELEMVLNGCPSFDEAIRLKQQYFAIESDPYHRVEPTVQEEIDKPWT